MTHKEFQIIYSHSLFYTGIAQFVATFLTLFSTQEESGKQDYGQLMALFGCILITACFPIFFIIFLKCGNNEKVKIEVEPSQEIAEHEEGEVETNQEMNLSKIEDPDALNVTVTI